MALKSYPMPRHLNSQYSLSSKYMPCLEWPVSAADHYAKLRGSQKMTGNHVGYMDTLIVCHALAENLILVTHNERDFSRIPGLKIENWVEQTATD